jgi:ATP adenylyltransferase
MVRESCPFCDLENSERVFFEDSLIRALWDGYPISPGHALVVPRRHVAGWFEATADERAALVRGIDAARAAILERHEPDGFNIGVNVGEAAGQTVFHLHVHLIPRYAGDVPDPRGGVRRLIPDKARYWDETEDEP